MGKKGKGVKFVDCTPNAVVTMFNRLGGFEVKEGAKHVKVIHKKSGKATTVPRTKRVNRYLLEQNIIKKFLVRDLGFSLKEVHDHLDC